MSLEQAPALLEDSRLSTSGVVCSLAQDSAGAMAESIRATLREAHAALAAHEPDLRKQLRESEHLAQELQSAFSARYGARLSSQPSPAGGSVLGTVLDLRDWCSRAEAALRSMAASSVRIRQSKRLQQQAEFAAQFGSLAASRLAVERAALQQAFDAYLKLGMPAAESVFADAVPRLRAQLDEMPAPPPVVGWLGPGAMEPEPVTGIGRLMLHVGFAVLTPMSVSIFRPQAASLRPTVTEATVQTGPFALPMLLDLDRDGGVVCDRPEPVNNTILRLLALLPAGQVRATVFDPARLGESADFLFELGEAAESVIGAKVKTTERELGEALLELEEHITFVTQKYLQGSFESLTEYNLAAGDVAEPYRLLVLYDFPRGFERPGGGGLDVEMVNRLQKIVEVGRRCGVFTLVVAPQGVTAAVRDAVFQLPCLWAGKPPNPGWLARLVLGSAETAGLALDFAGRASGDDQLQAARNGEPVFTGHAGAGWVYLPDEAAAPDTVAAILAQVERGIAFADDVRIGHDQVAELAIRKQQRDVSRGTKLHESLPRPSDPSTWWHGNSAEVLEASFGRSGAADVSTLRLDGQTASGVLIGGRPGSGKSVLLHALISSWSLRYSPEELELYLVDFKEGVEFKGYATGALPHARVVAIESDREFGLSVLRSLDDEIARRGTLFRDGSGEEVNLSAYRRRTGARLARIVLVVDEFHVLFERDDKIAGEAGELLDRIVRQGRAFGVHTVLASQTLAGTSGLGRHTLNLVPIRIALQCSDADSRLLLADDNADARLLTRPGEGIFNAAQGVRDANVRFQASYSSPEDRRAQVERLRALADDRGLSGRPVVFEGNEAVRVEDLAPGMLAGLVAPGAVRLPIGLPLTLAGPVVVEARREPGGNVLLVDDEDAAAGVLGLALGALRAAAVETDLVDFGALDSPWAASAEALGIRISRRREAEATLRALADLVEERQSLHDHRAPARVCMIAALHRARELDPSDVGGATEQLERILRDGPDVGVHVLAWCDKPVSLERRLSSSALREFGLRILGPMSRDDSFTLIDSEVASTISSSQVVLDDHDRAVTQRVRRFSLPSPAWLAALGTSG